MSRITDVVGGICMAFATCACITGPKAMDEPHPDDNAYAWKVVFDEKLSNAEFKAGSWRYDVHGQLVADTGDAIWTKADYENYVLDYEYRMEKDGNGGAFLYLSHLDQYPKYKFEVQMLDDFSPEYVGKEAPYQQSGSIYGRAPALEITSKRAGEWNRMTIYCQGKRIHVVHNGKAVIDVNFDDWKDALVNPDGTKIPGWHRGFPALSTIPTKGRIGFQGRHGKKLPDGRNAGFAIRNLRVAPLY